MNPPDDDETTDPGARPPSDAEATVVGGSLPLRLADDARKDSLSDEDELAALLREDVAEPVALTTDLLKLPLETNTHAAPQSAAPAAAHRDDGGDVTAVIARAALGAGAPTDRAAAAPTDRAAAAPTTEAVAPYSAQTATAGSEPHDLAVAVVEDSPGGSSPFERRVILLLGTLNVFAAANLILVAALFMQSPTASPTAEDAEAAARANEAALGAGATPQAEPVPEPSIPEAAAPSRRRSAPKAAQAPEPAPVAPPVAAAGDSFLTLRVVGASAARGDIAAKVYVDGKSVGNAPINNLPVAAGKRRIRFDCIFEGQTHTGSDKVLDLPSDTEAVVEHTCDVWVVPR